MTVKEFVEEFCKAEDKEKFTKKHVTTCYVPFEKKVALANNIVKKVMFVSNGDMIRNTPAVYMNYVLAIVSLYTDVEFQQDDSLEIYNLIEKHNIIPLLVAAIGNDASSLDAVIKMTVEDAINNHCDLVNFMTIKADNINLLLDKAQEVLGSVSKK